MTEYQCGAQHRENYRKSSCEKHFHNLKLNYNISIISRNVDDILIIHNKSKYIEGQMAQELMPYTKTSNLLMKQKQRISSVT